MKILHLDIETSPNLAWVWSLWKQNVAINQIKHPGEVLCWAAKWHGDKHSMFDRGKDRIRSVWSLLDEADAVVHFNGTDFDVPHLNREFVRIGMKPPSPFKEIDLLKVIRKRFSFPSNKLEYVAGALGIGQKVKHTGFELWIDCMKDDPKAWKLMEKYNRGDVLLTERLYMKLLPWIQSHPNVGLHNDSDKMSCTNCGGDSIRREGWVYTKTQRYQRFQCKGCGTWLRSRSTDLPIAKRKITLTQGQ